MARNILLPLFFISISNVVFSQYKIEGIVQNERQEATSFANIILLSEKGEIVNGQVADMNGVFMFNDILVGNYILNVTFIGFQDYHQNIELTGNLDLGLLTLVESSVVLEEVTVMAEKVPYIRKADRMIVNVSSLPTAAGSNALELMEKSPSVRLDRVTGNIALMGREDVVVYINGKRSRLNGTEMMQYLQSIPAASVESLELINSPPASYDADGTGGVINIVTKNYEVDGTIGNVNVYGGYGERGKYGGSATINHKSGKLNVYANGSISQDYTNQNIDFISAIQFDDGLLGSHQENLRPAYLGNFNGKIGLTYAIGANTSIDVFGSFARRRWELEGAETTTVYSGDISPISNDLLISDETNTTNQYHLSANLQQKFKNGHSFSTDYDYLNFNIVNPASYRLQNFNVNGELDSQVNFGSEKETPLKFHVARLDYKSNVYENLNFEVGAKVTLSRVENNTAFIDENGATVSDNPLTDEIDLNEQIYAAYFSIDGNLSDKFSFIGGLRYEYSNLELTAVRDGVNRQLSRLFPSLSLTRNFSEESHLTLAYRERIARPGYQILAPSFFFLNPYTVLSGDVQVLPNINRTVEITLNHKSLFISLSYSSDDNPLGFAVPILNQEENLLLLISDNLDDRKQLGLTVGFPIKFTKFWNSRYTIGNYWRRDKISFPDTTVIESNLFFSLDATQTFKLPQDWAFELSGNWFSKGYQGTIYFPERTSINFGVQKKFKNSSFGLSWTDIFNSGSFWNPINELSDRGIAYNWNYDLEGSIFRLSYTYNFGGRQVKNARNSGADDVIERVN